jgi:hypothetical protein
VTPAKKILNIAYDRCVTDSVRASVFQFDYVDPLGTYDLPPATSKTHQAHSDL